MIIMAMLFVKGKMYPKQFTVYVYKKYMYFYSVIMQNVCSMQACMWGGGVAEYSSICPCIFYMPYDGVTKEG